MAGDDGSITFTMPPICAVCGAQPSSIVRVKDDGISTDEKADVGNEIKNEVFYQLTGTRFGWTRENLRHDEAPDPLAQHNQDQLTALGVPVCSHHQGEVVVSAKSYNLDGGHSSELRFMSYLYYRAFVIVNGLPAKRTAS